MARLAASDTQASNEEAGVHCRAEHPLNARAGRQARKAVDVLKRSLAAVNEHVRCAGVRWRGIVQYTR